MTTHPSLELIQGELTRAESDLTGFRTRALTVVTTSAGVVTLLTGLVTFAASRAEEVASVLVTYLISVRKAADATSSPPAPSCGR